MHARTAAGTDVYYTVTGAGPPMLLVHGANCDADFMSPLAAHLRHRCCCIALDRPGYRRSGLLAHDTTIDEQAAAIRAVHAAVTAEPAWLFGHSSGGNFSMGYAMRYPAAVKGLVLMEPALYALYPADAKPWGVQHMLDVVLPLCRAGDVARGVAEFVRAIPMSAETGAEISALPFWHQIEANKAAFTHDHPVVIEWRPTDAELSRLPCPLLLLAGDRTNAILRDIVNLLWSKLPRGAVTTLAGCDHMAPQIRPRETARAVLDFVESNA